MNFFYHCYYYYEHYYYYYCHYFPSYWGLASLDKLRYGFVGVISAVLLNNMSKSSGRYSRQDQRRKALTLLCFSVQFEASLLRLRIHNKPHLDVWAWPGYLRQPRPLYRNQKPKQTFWIWLLNKGNERRAASAHPQCIHSCWENWAVSTQPASSSCGCPESWFDEYLTLGVTTRLVASENQERAGEQEPSAVCNRRNFLEGALERLTSLAVALEVAPRLKIIESDWM